MLRNLRATEQLDCRRLPPSNGDMHPEPREFAQDDPFDLARFSEAQSHSFSNALSEIRQGRKRTHWMWYIFPQIAGLGHSEMSRRYAVTSLAEAQAFLSHPVLGTRLRMCVAALQDLTGASPERIFGSVDAMKLASSLTLFAQAGGGQLFEAALDRWFGGPDAKTLELLQQLKD